MKHLFIINATFEMDIEEGAEMKSPQKEAIKNAISVAIHNTANCIESIEGGYHTFTPARNIKVDMTQMKKSFAERYAKAKINKKYYGKVVLNG